MRKITSAVMAALLLAPLALGCGEDEGPMERTGEQIDETVEEMTHPDEGPLEEAGRKTDEAIEEAKEKLQE